MCVWWWWLRRGGGGKRRCDFNKRDEYTCCSDDRYRYSMKVTACMVSCELYTRHRSRRKERDMDTE